jgi:NADPH:quinone reductase-like Zn-dependent oxidoreductase
MNKQMKAAVLHEFGAPTALKYESVDRPMPKAGEVLIKIHAAGINRLDDYLREGSVTPDINFPHILGSDACGEIAELGSGVSGFTVGERVILMPGYPLDSNDDDITPISAAASYAIRGIVEWGSYAEYMVAPANWVIKDKTGFSAEHVATLLMPLVTAVRAVRKVGEVKHGQKVLIHGGASSTGSTAIQVAKALGAEVATTLNSADKVDFVKSMGADLIIKTSSQDFVAETLAWTDGKGADVVIDNLGGEYLSRSLDALCPLGVIVNFGMVTGLTSTINLRSMFFTQKQIRGTLMGDREDLEWGLELFRLGKIKPSLDMVFPLSRAADAHSRLVGGKAQGTIVLVPDEKNS